MKGHINWEILLKCCCILREYELQKVAFNFALTFYFSCYFKKDKECKATAVAHLQQNILEVNSVPHNHDPPERQDPVMVLKRQLYAAAAKISILTNKEIYDEMIE